MIGLLQQILKLVQEILVLQQADAAALAKIEAQQVELLAGQQEIIKILTQPVVAGLEVDFNKPTVH